ncbi:MAG: hypothetical protein IJY60_05200 [Bacteroides sp.]|nr:hypothetical protein [Bacteroides sp.]
MATLDEILGGSPPGSEGNAPKAQSTGEKSPAPTPTHQKKEPDTVQSQSSTTGGTYTGGYEELFRQLNPYTPPTPEELEKEKKKQRRDAIFAAIGDGISALSNLYFTTQGAPNMYNGNNTMSERTKIRYDKLMKDREEKNTAYYNGLMKARQADADNAHKERSWKRQLGLDQEARDRYNENIQHRNEREAIADERYNKEQEENKRRWQTNFDESKRRADRSYNFNVQQHKDNLEVRKKQAQATAAKGVRGKQLGFADGNGNQVSIYENVWKGSMQQVYDAMLTDLAPTDEKERARWERQMKKLDTPQKKEDYVKQNWHKSPKASQIMLTLSSIDPANMTSEVNDDVEDYVPNNGGDDDMIDYVPGKK